MEYRKSNPAFREFLQQEMRRRNYNGREMGEAAGLSPSTMTRWFNGRLPSVESLKIASANLGWDLDEMLALSGHREQSTAPIPVHGLCARSSMDEQHFGEGQDVGSTPTGRTPDPVIVTRRRMTGDPV